MTKLALVLGTLLISVSALSSTSDLDGKTYCRTVISDGLFGQPKGERHHCIGFAEGVATDGANTFFGNPPERMKYEVNGRIVTFGENKYVIAKDLSDLVTINGATVEGVEFFLK